jgi:hypothetical protein
MPFISFYYLIVIARISNTMLSSSGKMEHCCLVLVFEEKDFIISSLSIKLSVGFFKGLLK